MPSRYKFQIKVECFACKRMVPVKPQLGALGGGLFLAQHSTNGRPCKEGSGYYLNTSDLIADVTQFSKG